MLSIAIRKVKVTYSAAALSTISSTLLQSASASATANTTKANRHSTSLASSWTQADVQLSRRSNYKGNDENDEELRRMLRENDDARNDLANFLAYAHDDSDFSQDLIKYLSADESQSRRYMIQQLEMSQNQLRNSTKEQQSEQDNTVLSTLDTHVTDALPRTLDEALRQQDRRAIVVTEATVPFRIVGVNRAWEELCGYSAEEAKNKTLGSLLHGPETNTVAATALIAQLLKGEKNVGTTLINYTKEKKRFYNRIRVGPIIDNSEYQEEMQQYFVGVLQEVQGKRMFG